MISTDDEHMIWGGGLYNRKKRAENFKSIYPVVNKGAVTLERFGEIIHIHMKLMGSQLEQRIEFPHDLIVEYKKTLSWKIENRELRDVHLLWTADDLPVAGSLAQTFPRPA